MVQGIPLRIASAMLVLGMLSSTAGGQSYVLGRANFGTGPGPIGVLTADFNDDGKLDLVVANFSSQTVSILLGKPDGTFQAHVEYTTGSSPIATTVADFNNDGKLDLATANQASGNISILLG